MTFLVWKIDVVESLRAVQPAVGWWLVAAFVVSFGLILISILKWKALLRSLGIDGSLGTLLRLYLMGGFGGLFLPGVIGGDFVRWHLSARELRAPRANVAASIVAERASGAAALVLLSVLVLAWQGSPFATPPALLVTGTIGLAAGGVIFLGVYRPLAILAARAGRRMGFSGTVRGFLRFHRSLRRYTVSTLLIAVGYGALFYLTNGLVLLCLANAFEQDLGGADALTAQLLTNLVGLLPISLSGLGLLQAGHVYFLGLVGVGASTAFAMSIVKQVITYGFGMIGGIMLIRRPLSDLENDPVDVPHGDLPPMDESRDDSVHTLQLA